MKYQLEPSNDLLINQTGLALGGALVVKTDLKKRLSRTALPKVLDPSITHADISKTYLGLLCQGKNFENIEQFRDDDLFRQALGDFIFASSHIRSHDILNMGLWLPSASRNIRLVCLYHFFRSCLKSFQNITRNSVRCFYL